MKRKTYIVDGFKGQNSKDAPEMLEKGEMVSLRGGFVNEDSSYDGDNVGTLSLKTGFSHEPIVIHAWKSSDGNEYVLTWGIETGAGVVNYYNKTSDGAINTTFITAMPIAFPPEFVNWGNEYIVMLAGRFGNYKITSSGGTLTSTATTDVSPANFGRVNAGALYLAQETSVIHSAVNNPLRFTPTREERLAGVYDLNNRLILSSAGVQGETMGYEIWKGYHIIWTQYDCYIAAWDGQGTAYATKLSGYGLYGMKGWAILDDKLAFYSTYKQASVCYIVTGTAGGNGETFTVGQNLQVSVMEAPGAKKISDILTACPKPTTKKKIVALDSKEDWEGSNVYPALSTLGFDTATTPGWVGLKGSAILTNTVVTTLPVTGVLFNPGSNNLAQVVSLTEGVDSYDRDLAPAPYPAVTPTPTYHSISAHCTNDLYPTRADSLAYLVLKALTPNGKVGIVDKDRLSAAIPGGNVWTSFVPSDPIKQVTQIEITIGINISFNKSGSTDRYSKIVEISKIYTLSSAYDIDQVNLHNVTHYSGSFGVDGEELLFSVGEVEIHGFGASTAVITTGPSATTSLSVTGLAAGTADLGLFQIGYQGYNDDGTGGLVGASAPTLVEVGIGTDANPATWGSAGATRGADVTTAKGSITYLTDAELKTGFKLSTLIRTGGGGGSVAFTFAAGGTLYMRARVPMTLGSSSYITPLLDRIIFDFESGSARLSTFPMFTWQHKTLLALMTNSSSTECDRAVAINDNGYCDVFDGVKWMAGFTGPDETIITAGKTLGKLGEGTDNLVWDGSASTNTPTTKKITLPKIKGINKLFARAVKFAISKFVPAIGITANSTGEILSTTGTVNIEDTSVTLLAGDNDTNTCVVGSDGCIYFLTPYVPPTRTYPCYVRLIKFDPSTSAYTNLDIDATFVYDQQLWAHSIAISEDKQTLYLFWAGVTATGYRKNWRARTYDVPTAALGTVATVTNPSSGGSDQWVKMSAIVHQDTIYCASSWSATADKIVVYKSTDNGATYTADTTITPGNGIGSGTPIKLSLNSAGDIVLSYSLGSTSIYEYYKSNGLWGSVKTLTVAANATLDTCSAGGYDYLFTRSGTTISAYYKYNDVWTLITTISSVAETPVVGVQSYYETAILTYSTTTKLMQMEFLGKVYSPATEVGTLYARNLYWAQNPASDELYGFFFSTTPGYFRPYKMSIAECTTPYPIQILVTTEKGTTVAYEHPHPINKLMYIPQRQQDLRTIQGNFLQAKLTAYGQIKCHGVGIEYDEQEGSL